MGNQIIVIGAIVGLFAIFAAVLAWADVTTNRR